MTTWDFHRGLLGLAIGLGIVAFLLWIKWLNWREELRQRRAERERFASQARKKGNP